MQQHDNHVLEFQTLVTRPKRNRRYYFSYLLTHPPPPPPKKKVKSKNNLNKKKEQPVRFEPKKNLCGLVILLATT